MGEISDHERKRLKGLIERFDLAVIADDIFRLAEPCIALALDDPPEPRPDVWPEPQIGASKVGGLPDLPPGWGWPVNDNGYAGFMMQIALAELAGLPDFLLPRHGMLYVFCWDDARSVYDPPGWELRWWDGDRADLQRAIRPEGPCASEGGFFEDADPRPILARIGTDLPPKSQGDWDFPNDLDRRFRGKDDALLDRYLEFHTRARDPDAEADAAKGRGPYFYPVGQLFGRTDRNLRHSMALASRGEADRMSDYDWRARNAAGLDRDGAVWRQVLQIESNPATGYMSPADSAPVYILARDDGVRPWMPFGPVYGFASK